MTHLKLTLAYDGAAFVGWQRQSEGESIQQLLEDALARLDKQPVTVHGAGRTDAGVHALAQVASVTLARDIDPDTVRRALNAHLPPAVRVRTVEVVEARFHARFSTTSKRYRYRIWNSEVLDPFERGRCWHVPAPHLDIDAMQAAAGALVGTHDFSSFQGAGATTVTAVRTVFESRVTRAWPDGRVTADAPLVTYEVRGTGFLRHMVRSIAGTLVDVGRRRWPPAHIADILAAQSRPAAGETAPAAGLFLVSVSYDGGDL